MNETPLFINSILNYVHQESRTLENEILDFFVATESFKLLKNKVAKGVKFINLTGLGGTGKTTNAKVLSLELQKHKKISFLSSGEEIDLRKSQDVLFIDNIEQINENRLSRILNSKRIKQFIVLSRRILNFEKINFEVITIPNLNQAQIKNLIQKRLHKLDSKAGEIVYESVIKNREILKSKGSPKAILKFLNNTYSDISQKVNNPTSENITKNEPVKIPLSSVIGILISIMLFLLTQRNSKISTATILETINDNQNELIELIETGKYHNDLDLCYLVSEDLNIRNFPRKNDSEILKIASKNSTIKVIEKRSKWWYVESQDLTSNEITNGWVYSDYLLPIK